MVFCLVADILEPAQRKFRPHLSQGGEMGRGAWSGRLQIRARAWLSMGPNKLYATVQLTVRPVCAGALVMNEIQIILKDTLTISNWIKMWNLQCFPVRRCARIQKG